LPAVSPGGDRGCGICAGVPGVTGTPTPPQTSAVASSVSRCRLTATNQRLVSVGLPDLRHRGLKCELRRVPHIKSSIGRVCSRFIDKTIFDEKHETCRRHRLIRNSSLHNEAFWDGVILKRCNSKCLDQHGSKPLVLDIYFQQFNDCNEPGRPHRDAYMK